MQTIRAMQMIADTSEESMPNFDEGFPCITNRAELNAYPNAIVPWHWHPTVELFYVSEGELQYQIPGEEMRFEQGSGGMLIPEVIHRSVWSPSGHVVQLLHLFDPSLLFGDPNMRMAQEYTLPVLDYTTGPLFKFDPQDSSHALALSLLRGSFALDPSSFDYDYQLRDHLCRIWLQMLSLFEEDRPIPYFTGNDPRMKSMMVYVNEHLEEELDVQKIAVASYMSTRACYRMFREYLHTSPTAYIRSCRIRRACVLLRQEKASITEAALRCGFEDSSYFSRVFREVTGYTPREFRKMAQ